MSYTVFYKDSDAILDYQVDWETWLNGDTISSSDWTVPSGLTEASATNTSSTATVWLSGGTVGTRYTVTNQIVTVGGRTNDQSFIVIVTNK